MAPTLLFAAQPTAWDDYQAPLRRALADEGLQVNLCTEALPETVDYIVYAPNSGLEDFRPFTRLKAVLSLWAGVETITPNPTLTVPLARMVDPGLTQGMTEWVVGHVLRHHLGLDAHVHGLNGAWTKAVPPLAQDRPVTILGLGELGLAAARALTALGFPVTGYSRSPRTHPGLRCLHGAQGLAQALHGAQIVVGLLPDTPDTHGLLNAERLALLAPGAVVINPGRGTLIDDDALLAALDRGHLGHATLDVFRVEPLPVAHRFWRHPRVTVTPHIASETRPASAARTLARNIARAEAGQPLLHLVDRNRGY